MVGNTDWNIKTYEVIQRGSKMWTGKVKVWDGSTGEYKVVSGRRAAGEVAGNWAPGDTIQLQACVACAEPGI